MVVSFRVNALQVVGAPASRSVINPGTDTDEGTAVGYTPSDVWVIQYDGVADDAALAGLPRYVEISGPAQIQAVASASDNTLVFVANTHNANLEWGNISTLGLFKQVSRRIERESDCYGNNSSLTKDLIFSGRYVGPITDGRPLTAELFRNIVRLDFTLSNSLGSAMTLKTVQLCNVPRLLHYGAGIIAKDILFPHTSLYFDYPAQVLTVAATPGGEQSFTFYMPVNQQGTNPASTSSKTKPTHAPGHSSYIRIVASDPQGQAFAYKIYPGANMVDDYNLSANHRYQVQIAINSAGDASTDGRVENYGHVDLPSCNSYILNPAPEGSVERVFTIPIGRLNDFWRNMDPDLTLAQGESWTVDLIWQDVPQSDFIRFVDPLTSQASLAFQGTGLNQRIALTTKAGYNGNALIGIKKDARQEAGYLWTWHLWVTDYDPRYGGKAVDDVYVYPVTGGEVHRYSGTAWTSSNPVNGFHYGKYIMDRNLGARSAGYVTDGALFYQFGRKEPMTGGALYDIQGVPLDPSDPKNCTTMIKNTLTGVTQATAVLNPTFFYCKNAMSGHGDWAVDGKGDIYPWNHIEPGIDQKSIFDPCPPGWKLPLYGVWVDFVYSPATPALSTALDVRRDPKLGWGFPGFEGLRYWPRNLDVAGSIYYPAIGLRHIETGLMGGAPHNGFLWTSMASSDISKGYNIAFTSGSVGMALNSRAYAFSVRCVQE